VTYLYTDDGRPKSMLHDGPDGTIYTSPVVYINKHAIEECINIVRDDDLVREFSMTEGESREAVWRLTGCTHPEYSNYLEAVWPD
jgi:hypothetical protein